MQQIRKLVDNIKPTFEKGGKLSFLHSAFDSVETFLFTPNTTAQRGAHIRDAIDLKRTMFTVIIALMPALLFGIYNVGLQHFLSLGDKVAANSIMQCFSSGLIKFLPLLIVSYVVGLGIEIAFAQVRGHEVSEGYLVSGLLIPLIVPINIPLWQLAVAVAFAVIIAKEAFGGTGMNIFNPALMARAFLFFSYPSEMSGDKVWVYGLAESGGAIADGFTGATFLGQAATQAATLADGGSIQRISFSIYDMFVGTVPGSVGETSKIAILIGAAILLIARIGNWRIMLSGVLGAVITGLLFNAIAPNEHSYLALPFWHHLFVGGFLFALVFMATDPVTAAQTNRGRWIYGALIGFFTVLWRPLNPAYPEGAMLAILLMNLFAPLIDYIVIQLHISKRLKRARAISL